MMRSSASPPAPANADRKQAGRFVKGQSGNPGGKKPGTRHRATQAALALMQGEVAGIARAVINAALGGDLVAARVVLDRVAPAPRDGTVMVNLPPVTSPGDLPAAMVALLEAVAAGIITPGEAEAVARIFDAYRAIVETADFDARLRKLEMQIDAGS